MSPKVKTALTSEKKNGQIKLAIDELDDESRKLAQWLHQTSFIYGLYGLLDGLSLTYSMIKYSFDLICTGSETASDVMHNWMLTPLGLTSITKFSIVLIGFSILGNLFKDSDENAFKRYIAISWPYVRDFLKGLKNGYKGIGGTVKMLASLSGMDMRQLILPIGVAIGVLSALNRIFIRACVVEPRKGMMVQNSQLLEKIKASGPLDAAASAAFRKEIKMQSMALRSCALVASAYGGIVDGMYLFMGAMSLATVAPPIFIAMALLSGIYTLSNVLIRVYEEYDYQRKLVATQAQIELALCGKELEDIFNKLQEISENRRDELNMDERVTKLKKQLDLKMEEFEVKRNCLRAQTSLSQMSAALAGLKKGLVAYGALSSVFYAISAINAILLAPFPPALMIFGITIGLAFLIGFVSHSLYENKKRLEAQKPKESKCHRGLADLLQAIKLNNLEVSALKPETIVQAIRGGEFVDSSPPYFFLEYAEVFRSVGASLKKSITSVDYVLNCLEDRDSLGHFHETETMLGIALFATTVSASIFGMRALAKGLGRPGLNVVIEEPKDLERVEAEIVNAVEEKKRRAVVGFAGTPISHTTPNRVFGGLGSSITPPPRSESTLSRGNSRHAFFNTPPAALPQPLSRVISVDNMPTVSVANSTMASDNVLVYAF